MRYLAKFKTPPELGIDSMLVEASSVDEARAAAELRAGFWKPAPEIADVVLVPRDHPLYEAPK